MVTVGAFDLLLVSFAPEVSSFFIIMWRDATALKNIDLHVRTLTVGRIFHMLVPVSSFFFEQIPCLLQ